MKKEDGGYKVWRSSAPRGIFVLVHGLGAHSERWAAMADFFLGRNIASYALDLPNLNSVSNFYGEILRVREIAAKDNPGKPVFLVGESLGALASFLFIAEHPELFNGLVCISPAFASRKKIGLPESVKMIALSRCDPARKVKLPFDSSMCTRDTDYREKMDNDPLEYRSISSALVFEILAAQARARSASKKIKLGVLFLLSGEDMIVDTGISKKIFNGLPSQDKTLREFSGMYHSLSIELGKEAVFEDLFNWVEKRL